MPQDTYIFFKTRRDRATVEELADPQDGARLRRRRSRMYSAGMRSWILLFAFIVGLNALTGCEDPKEDLQFWCDDTYECTDSERTVCDYNGACAATVPNMCIRPSEVCWDAGVGSADGGAGDAGADATP